MADLLRGYLAGECEAVHAELQALGPAVHEEPHRAAAEAVATEMMSRVRRNAELLSERWRKAGWEFGYHWAPDWAHGSVRVAPKHLGTPVPDAAAQIDRTESRLGPLPVVLRAFITQIGSLNFVGAPNVPPELAGASREEMLAAGWVWPGRETCDPLYVHPDLQDFEDEAEPGVERDLLILWPDSFHKYFVSGAGSYGTWIPQSGFDAQLYFTGLRPVSENGVMRFLTGHDPLDGRTLVSYLREIMLTEGGFGTDVTDDAHRDQDFIRRITVDLEPF